jgi:hypothetical protein
MIGKIEGEEYGYGMTLPIPIPALPSLWGTVGPRTTNKERTTQIGWIGMACYQLFFFPEIPAPHIEDSVHRLYTQVSTFASLATRHHQFNRSISKKPIQ